MNKITIFFIYRQAKTRDSANSSPAVVYSSSPAPPIAKAVKTKLVTIDK